jgi:integrase
MSFDSLASAERFVNKVADERSRKLDIDYTKSASTTFAQLLVRFLLEESARRRSFALEAYKIEGWLADSGSIGMKLLQRYRDELERQGKPVRAAAFQMRESATSVEWIHKPLSAIVPEDIERFMRDRLDDVTPATVDRELDILSSVFNVATKVWQYPLLSNPMTAVRRPRYFNERDRRLMGDEHERLVAAAQALDTARAGERRLRERVEEATREMTFSSPSARKKVCAALAKQLGGEPVMDAPPFLEAFVAFQLATAARRAETLGLTWDRVDFDAQTAYLPVTKNGRPRKLSLRSDLLDLLERLPRTDERVFPLGTDFVVGAWRQICERAGIKDLHIHDLRHEAISQAAEIGGLGLVELQAFSGHRDLRMLMRYAHLCASRIASRLDEAFAKAPVRKGRRRLGSSSAVKIADITAAMDLPSMDSPPDAASAHSAEDRPSSPVDFTVSHTKRQDASQATTISLDAPPRSARIIDIRPHLKRA